MSVLEVILNTCKSIEIPPKPNKKADIIKLVDIKENTIERIKVVINTETNHFVSECSLEDLSLLLSIFLLFIFLLLFEFINK